MRLTLEIFILNASFSTKERNAGKKTFGFFQAATGMKYGIENLACGNSERNIKKNLFNALFGKEEKNNIFFYIGEFKTADFVECDV